MDEKRKERIVELFTYEGEDAAEIKCTIIGGLISSHSNTCHAERERNLALLLRIRDALKNVPGTEFYHEMSLQGVEILQRELQEEENKSQIGW